MHNHPDAAEKDELSAHRPLGAASPDDGRDALVPGAEAEALTQLVRLIQQWAHSRDLPSEALAKEVANAQQFLSRPPRPAVHVSTSWFKRVRSGRLLPSAEGGLNVVDSRYKALFLLVAQSQLGGAAPTSRGAAPPTTSGNREVDRRCMELVERWSDQLLSHWRGRGSAAESRVQLTDPLEVVKEFEAAVDDRGTTNKDLKALGVNLARFLVNASVNSPAGNAAMLRLAADRAPELVARLGDRAARSPAGMEGQEAFTNRFIRAALSKLAEKLANGTTQVHPMTALIMVPILDKLVEVSCDLRQPDDPTLFAWLTAVVAPK